MPTTHPANAGEWDGGEAPNSKGDEKLLSRIRDRYDYMVRAWKEIREEGSKDMQALSVEGPWDSDEREARRNLNRPTIHLDQLSQHTNTLINEVKQEPFGINIDPTGFGANEEKAELRQDRIRQIEYENDASDIYLDAFESTVERSYGVFGILTDDLDWDRDEKRIIFRRFPNPDAVMWDPDCKKRDCSDMRDAFVLTTYHWEEFKEKWPDARIQDFSNVGGDERIHGKWIIHGNQTVQVAEYWCTKYVTEKIYWVADPSGRQFRMMADDIAENEKSWGPANLDDVDESEGSGFITFEYGGPVLEVKRFKKAQRPVIYQYITNGLEILETTEWPGRWIPIIPVLGKQKFYKNEDGELKREIESYIRHARAGQMLFDYYVSSEAEAIGLSPKVTWVGYEGQFETNTDWPNINKIPLAYGEVKARTDESGDELLPLPQRQGYEPPIQAIELGKESTRRSIQAAVGSYGFTQQDDPNVSHGVVMDRLERNRNVAAYHLIKNLKSSIRHAGRIVDDLLDKVEDGPMEVAVRRANESREVLPINQDVTNDRGEKVRYRYSDSPEERYEATISVGPSFQSQRDEASEFVDTFIQAFAPVPQIIMRALPLLIRLKNLGPIGDELEDAVTPPDMKAAEEAGLPPEALQVIQQLKGENESLQQMLQQAAFEKQAKVVETQGKAMLQQRKSQADTAMKSADIASSERVAVLEAQLAKYKADLEAAQDTQRILADLQKSVAALQAPGPAN